jgi:hypothetical protein
MKNMKTLVILAALLGAACNKKDANAPVTGANVSGTPTSGAQPAAAAAPMGLTGADGKSMVASPATESKVTAISDVLSVVEDEKASLGENKPAFEPPKGVLGNTNQLGAGDMQDGGDFKVVIQNGNDTPVRQALAKGLQGMAEALNGLMKLPKDIPIIMKKCGEPNAFWDPNSQTIIMCDEFPEFISTLYSTFKPSQEEVLRATIGATMFVFLHELGHCLIDQYELPATGREEDAVDQMATLILVAGGKDSTQFALDGAEAWLAIQVMRSAESKEAFWDEHSLDEQRFYNIMCLIYGSNPSDHKYMVDEGDLPKARAVRCQGEFKRNYAAWDRLLTPFMKKQG